MQQITGFNRTFYENGGMFAAVRLVSYDDSNSKEYVDIRKYSINSDGSEMMLKGKGIALTQEAANDLVVAMLEENIGDTRECLKALESREDFVESIEVLSNETRQLIRRLPDKVFSDADDFVDIREEMMV